DNRALDDTRVQHPADWADPVVDVDFRAAQAQRRLTAQGDAMGALSTGQTAVCAIAHFLRVPTPKHLVHEAIIVAGIVARLDVLQPVPVLDTDLLEDVPVLRGCCKHAGAPSWGRGRCVVQLLYHVSPPQSTPSSACTEARSPPSLTLEPRGLQASRKM